jgi:hypothetical protein
MQNTVLLFLWACFSWWCKGMKISVLKTSWRRSSFIIFELLIWDGHFTFYLAFSGHHLVSSRAVINDKVACMLRICDKWSASAYGTCKLPRNWVTVNMCLNTSCTLSEVNARRVPSQCELFYFSDLRNSCDHWKLTAMLDKQAATIHSVDEIRTCDLWIRGRMYHALYSSNPSCNGWLVIVNRIEFFFSVASCWHYCCFSVLTHSSEQRLRS